MGKVIPLKPIITDRSGEETDEKCGMAYYWNRVSGGVGISKVDQAVFYRIGSEVHADMEGYAQGKSVDEVLAGIPSPDPNVGQVGLEEHYRRLGWVVAWGLYEEPFLRKHFNDISYEAETVLARDGLWVSVTPDRVQRTKTDQRLVYREWKTAGSFGKGWQDHWNYAIQLHLGLMAIKEEFNEVPAYGQVTGLYKGREMYGRLAHPYVWAYFKDGNWSTSYKPGWDHRPVWEYEGGIREWVEKCGEEVGKSQFCYSAPVVLDQKRVEDWFKVRVVRHKEIEQYRNMALKDEAVRREHFPQRSIHCRPTFGPECQFLGACYNKSIHDDPIGSGLYEVRVPHHDLERIGVE